MALVQGVPNTSLASHYRAIADRFEPLEVLFANPNITTNAVLNKHNLADTIRQVLKEELQPMKEDIKSTREDLKSTREDLTTQIDAVKEDLKSFREDLTTKIDAFKEDLTTKIDAVKEDLKSTREDLTTKIDAVKEDLKSTWVVLGPSQASAAHGPQSGYIQVDCDANSQGMVFLLTSLFHLPRRGWFWFWSARFFYPPNVPWGVIFWKPKGG